MEPTLTYAGLDLEIMQLALSSPARLPQFNGNISHPSVANSYTVDQWFQSYSNVNAVVNLGPLTHDTVFALPGRTTCQAHGYFTYRGSHAYALEVSAESDVFVFVADELVLDRGGLGAQMTTAGQLPTNTSLVIGERYPIDIFFTNRRTLPAQLVLNSTLCEGCTSSGGVYDDCLLCNGTNTTCLGCDSIPLSGLHDDVYNTCGGDGVPPGPVTPPTNSPIPLPEGAIVCRVTPGAAPGSLVVEVGAPTSIAAGAFIVGPNSYNADIRERELCDNRISTLSAPWSSLWTYGAALSPNWQLSVSPAAGNLTLYTYSREFGSVEGLMACSGTPLSVLQPSTSTVVHSGHMYLAHAVPAEFEDVEDTRWETVCAYQVHEGTSGITTITTQPTSPVPVPAIDWVHTQCLTETEDHWLSVTVRTCSPVEYHLANASVVPGALALARIEGGYGGPGAPCDWGYEGQCCQHWELLVPLTNQTYNATLQWFIYLTGANSSAIGTAESEVIIDTAVAEQLLCLPGNECGGGGGGGTELALEPTANLTLVGEATGGEVLADGAEVCALLEVSGVTGAPGAIPYLQVDQVLLGYWTTNGTDIVLLYSEGSPSGDPYYNFTLATARFVVVQHVLTTEYHLEAYMCWIAHAVSAYPTVQTLEVHWSILYTETGGSPSPQPYHAAMRYSAGFVHQRVLHHRAQLYAEAVEMFTHSLSVRVQCGAETEWSGAEAHCLAAHTGRAVLPIAPGGQGRDTYLHDHWSGPGDHLPIMAAIVLTLLIIIAVLVVVSMLYWCYDSCARCLCGGAEGARRDSRNARREEESVQASTYVPTPSAAAKGQQVIARLMSERHDSQLRKR